MDIQSLDKGRIFLAKATEYKRLLATQNNNDKMVIKFMSYETDIHNHIVMLKQRIILLIRYICVYYTVRDTSIKIKIANLVKLTKKYKKKKHYFESNGIKYSHFVKRAKIDAQNARDVLHSFIMKDMIKIHQIHKAIKQDVEKLNTYFEDSLM